MKFIHLTYGLNKMAVNVDQIAWVELIAYKEHQETRIYFAAGADDYLDVHEAYETVLAMIQGMHT